MEHTDRTHQVGDIKIAVAVGGTAAIGSTNLQGKTQKKRKKMYASRHDPGFDNRGVKETVNKGEKEKIKFQTCLRNFLQNAQTCAT